MTVAYDDEPPPPGDEHAPPDVPWDVSYGGSITASIETARRRRNGAAPHDRVPPHDLDAEEALLGAILLDAGALQTAREHLRITDWYGPLHRSIYGACVALADRGEAVDPVTVAAEMRARGDAADLADLNTLMAGVPAISNAPVYARIIAQCARGQELLRVVGELREQGYACDLDGAAATIERAATITRVVDRQPDGLDVDAFLAATADEQYDWVVPGLLEHGDRVILTGSEGRGKSTLSRQTAVMMSAGIHPFSLADITPCRVLVIDAENSTRHLARCLRPLRLAARNMDPSYLRVVSRPAGVDLLDRGDAAWLDAEVRAAQADMLAVGPLYKLASGDPLSEEVARQVAAVLDRVRTEHACALLIEAHSPHAVGRDQRPERPYGASLWMRWPEFGLHLDAADRLRHWRGDRDVREWPKGLRRGGAWPFTVAPEDPATVPVPAKGGGTTTLEAAVLQVVLNADGPISQRKVEDGVAEIGSFGRERIRNTAKMLAETGRLSCEMHGNATMYGPPDESLHLSPPMDEDDVF